MKESYIEDLANHGGPESCVGDPRGRSEALTGVHAGWLLSPEIGLVWGADALGNDGRQPCWRRFREPLVDPAGSENPACVRALHAENWEVSRSPACCDGGAGRAGKAKAVIP